MSARTPAPWGQVRSVIWRTLGLDPNPQPDALGNLPRVDGATEDIACDAFVRVADRVEAWRPGDDLGEILGYAATTARAARVDAIRERRRVKRTRNTHDDGNSHSVGDSGQAISPVMSVTYDTTVFDRLTKVDISLPIDREVWLAEVADWARPALRNPNLDPLARTVIERLVSQPEDLWMHSGDKPLDVFVREYDRAKSRVKKAGQRSRAKKKQKIAVSPSDEPRLTSLR